MQTSKPLEGKPRTPNPFERLGIRSKETVNKKPGKEKTPIKMVTISANRSSCNINYNLYYKLRDFYV